MIRKLASILCLGLLASAAHANEGIDTAAFFSASLTGLDGQPVAMEKFRGRPLIVNFWARWCGPCRDEIPELVRLREAQGEDGIIVGRRGGADEIAGAGRIRRHRPPAPSDCPRR